MADTTNRNILRCLVVDDEPLAAKLISTYVSRTPFLELVAEVYTAEEALDILNGSDIDIAFLDIQIPRLSGMELARMIKGSTSIVFTTAYSQYAVEGFRINATDYLLKPVSYEEFLQAAGRVLERKRHSIMPPAEDEKPPTHLLVKSEYRLLRVDIADIEYVEGLKDYVKIYLEGEPKPILTLMSMKAIADSLPADGFMRVHRSFIVNLDKVKVVERAGITMAGRSIPVSDSCRTAFMEALAK